MELGERVLVTTLQQGSGVKFHTTLRGGLGLWWAGGGRGSYSRTRGSVCVCGGVGGWVGAWVRRWGCRQTSGRGVVGRSVGNVGATSYSSVGGGASADSQVWGSNPHL